LYLSISSFTYPFEHFTMINYTLIDGETFCQGKTTLYVSLVITITTSIQVKIGKENLDKKWLL